jgi:hypothetical protein
LYLEELKDSNSDPKNLQERIMKKMFKLFYILYGIKLSFKKEIFKKLEESRMEPLKTMNRKEISSIGLEIFIPTLDSSISANKSTSVHDQSCQILRKFLENFEILSSTKENLIHTQSFVDGKKKMEEIEWKNEKDSFQCNSSFLTLSFQLFIIISIIILEWQFNDPLIRTTQTTWFQSF